MLAVDALVGGSLRPTVSFGRLQRHLSWKTQQLSDVLEYCGQAGRLRIEGEPQLLSHRGTHAGLTPAGASLAEWIRAGRPEDEASATYTFNAAVTDSNFAYGCSGGVRQVTGGGRIDALECARLIEAVRDEPRPEALPIRSHAEALLLLDEIEEALRTAEPNRDHLRTLAVALRDVCIGATGNGMWAAVCALVAYLA